jgi:hypothetical protein
MSENRCVSGKNRRDKISETDGSLRSRAHIRQMCVRLTRLVWLCFIARSAANEPIIPAIAEDHGGCPDHSSELCIVFLCITEGASRLHNGWSGGYFRLSTVGDIELTDNINFSGGAARPRDLSLPRFTLCELSAGNSGRKCGREKAPGHLFYCRLGWGRPRLDR